MSSEPSRVGGPESPPVRLRVEGLTRWFRRPRMPFQRARFVQAVTDVSFHVAVGETLGLVGESGCGKSTLGRAVLRLTEVDRGAVHLRVPHRAVPEPLRDRVVPVSTEEGTIDLAQLSMRRLRPLRRHMQVVFQDPFASLDPRMTVGASIGEGLVIHRVGTRATRRERVAELLRLVGLDPDAARSYPHEFSGGQRQRVGIARALALEPSFLVCDEAVSALDVSVQAQILNLLQDLQERLALSMLFISHDLSVVRHLCQRVAVMYLGRIVEVSARASLFDAPRHPYTQALLRAIPRLEPRVGDEPSDGLRGEVPSPVDPPPGCAFHTRCPIKEARCLTERPELRAVAPGHEVACHLA
ncbi:MAG: ABC transporter ATP-binding protein [Planctomycetes bacterium]|nr:ABC transporter ATP-binding protein [Planctomycetota bacterium]